MWLNPQFPWDLVAFTEDISNEKLHFLCSDTCSDILLYFITDMFVLYNFYTKFGPGI